MKRYLIYWTKLIGFGLVAGLVGLYVTYFIVEIYLWTTPVPSTPCCLPQDTATHYQEVSIPSTDDITLAGWYAPSQNGAVIILLHGYGSNRAAMLPHAQYLTQAGYGVLLYDMRGHGESTGQYRSGGWADVDDVASAVHFLTAASPTSPDHIGILGFSIGGQVALRAAAQIDELEAVVADGPGLVNNLDAPQATNALEHALRIGNVIVNKATEWRTGEPEPPAVVEVIGDIAPKPIFLIATGSELGSEYRIVSAYFEAARDPKTLWTIPEASHGTGLEYRPDAYPQQVLAFFDNRVRQPKSVQENP